MNWTIDTPVRAGQLVVVPIVDVTISVESSAFRLAAHGAKRPAMMLVFREAGVIGVDMDGKVHDAAGVERRYPQAIAQATARLAKETA
ncbi:MAG: hypothetical protein AAFY31_01985 [Pseudomonadota bacterium]